MTRFNPDKYDPRTDSSEGSYRPSALVLNLPTENACGCGCKGEVLGKKSRFQMGHDARLKGMLTRAHLADVPVVVLDHEGTAIERSAIEHAGTFGEFWVTTLDKASAKATAQRARAGAQPEPTPTAGPAAGDLRLVKVGRWEYTGKVVGVDGDQLVVAYEDKKGGTHEVRVAK